jgi:hypothetical protein
MRRKPPQKPQEVITDAPALFLPRCPLCDDLISTQATVEEFGSPQGWQFYGRSGERWIKCRGNSGTCEFIHFITLINGRPSNRLAWIKPTGQNDNVEQGILL